MTSSSLVSTDLASLCRDMADAAKAASRVLGFARGDMKNAWLRTAARRFRAETSSIVEANAQDVSGALASGLTKAAIDRLTLTPARVEAMARGLEEVIALPDPIGEVIHSGRRPNGLDVMQIRVPLGVVFMIYESRPNVTVDAAALCVKSGNAAILRGGSEAFHSNMALHAVLADALDEVGLPRASVQLVPTTDRAAVGRFLALGDLIDLAIPRGGEDLIRRVAAEASMPVLKHYHGNCHVYLDASADAAMSEAIIINSKVQRPGVCNAAETLLVHQECAPRLLPRLAQALIKAGVELRGDAAAREHSQGLITVAAVEDDWGREYLDLILAVAVTPSLDAAIEHITRYGSGHTEAIVTNDYASAREFMMRVDSSAVMVNAATRFNDGGELGLGAEIGISTDKFHARGPCGLQSLTSTKWIVQGAGHIRS